MKTEYQKEHQGNICCQGCYKIGMKEGKELTLKEVFEEIDRLEFTNLLRENKCINVNDVMDKIKEELEKRLRE